MLHIITDIQEIIFSYSHVIYMKYIHSYLNGMLKYTFCTEVSGWRQIFFQNTSIKTVN